MHVVTAAADAECRCQAVGDEVRPEIVSEAISVAKAPS
jgi:hypothetical protein